MAAVKFSPDDKSVKKSVRTELKLRNLIPVEIAAYPENTRLDLHNKTVETAWTEINKIIDSGTVRRAQVITGASGVLKPLFIDWVMRSTIATKITSCHQTNNGSFEIKIKKPNP